MKLFKALSAIDKQAHFGWGAMICAVITIITLLQDVSGPLSWHTVLYCAIGTVAAMVFQIFKEFLIDDRIDKLDILATFLGTLTIWAATAIGVLFNILSH